MYLHFFMHMLLPVFIIN